MEKITQEIFKSGDKIFLTEKECLKYENIVMNDNLRKEIIDFLVSEGFKQAGVRLNIITFGVWVHEFNFIGSDFFTYKKFYCSNNKWNYILEPPKENITLSLCKIIDFKIFYNNILKLEKEE